jgi:uncharacterized protein (TIGR03435 family)
VNTGDRAIGIGAPPSSILRMAYQWPSFTRMVLPSSMPAEQYDYLANLPTGSFEALRDEVKKTLGLTAERQTRPTDVLLLRLDHTNAPGFAVATTPGRAGPNDPNVLYFSYATTANLISYLEAVLAKPIIDETGLTGHYEIRVPRMNRTRAIPTEEWIEQNRQKLLEQLGLNLVPTNQPVELLVVSKVNP